MREPEDYGLSPEGTLIQVAPWSPPAGFVQFWSSWQTRVMAGHPRLTPCRESEPLHAGAPGVTHVFESVRHVRIGARLSLPETPVRGVVVTSHGYHVPAGEPLSDRPSWTSASLATLVLRVRGYPGSQMDTGDLSGRAEGYAAIGLEEPGASILFDAIADVFNAVRAARDLFGPGVPVMLHGESFGGALAILAASMLESHGAPGRMVIGVPTFGWWSWRLTHPTRTGAGHDIARALAVHRDRQEQMIESLALLDTVVHARRAVSPTLCKIAQRDDVVPAPTAAAVYNALGCDPGRKWRFVTRYGHFDGGLADLRRHALFERIAEEFLDPTRDADEVMAQWEPALMALDAPRPPMAVSATGA